MKLTFTALLLLSFYIPLLAQNHEWQSIEIIDTIPGYRFIVEKVESYKYPPSNLFDASLKTCWIVGDSPIFLRVNKTDKSLNIFGGYGKSESLYTMNDRPKTIKLSYYIGIHPEAHVSEIAAVYYLYPTENIQTMDVKDSLYTFHQKLPEIGDATYKKALKKFKQEKGIPVSEMTPVIKFEVVDKYSGSKYQDLCISEVYLSDKYVHYIGDKKYSSKVKDFVINKAENTLMARCADGNSRILYRNLNKVVWFGEASSDKSWLTVLTMPVEDQGEGLTNYLLIHSLTGDVLNNELEKSIGHKITQIFLVEKENKTYAECYTRGDQKYLLELHY
ncbi:MAG: hypothetical protein ABFS32_14945 [Bacteroidota bacterium]